MLTIVSQGNNKTDQIWFPKWELGFCEQLMLVCQNTCHHNISTFLSKHIHFCVFWINLKAAFMCSITLQIWYLFIGHICHNLCQFWHVISKCIHLFITSSIDVNIGVLVKRNVQKMFSKASQGKNRFPLFRSCQAVLTTYTACSSDIGSVYIFTIQHWI